MTCWSYLRDDIFAYEMDACLKMEMWPDEADEMDKMEDASGSKLAKINGMKQMRSKKCEMRERERERERNSNRPFSQPGL